MDFSLTCQYEHRLINTPKHSSFKRLPHLLNSPALKSIFFSLISLPAPAPAIFHSSSHSSQGLRDRKWTPASWHFIRQFPRANELQPWLWSGSVNLINDWEAATIISPSDSPKCTYSPAGKEGARKEHQRALLKHKHQGQSQARKAWAPTPVPDGKGFPHLLFRQAAGRWGSRRGEVSNQGFPHIARQSGRITREPTLLEGHLYQNADWKRNCPKF